MRYVRLGHLNSNDLIQMLEKNQVSGLNFNDSVVLSKCSTCLTGKITSTPFVKREIKRETTSSKLLEIVHTDVCGPMRVTSISGARYFVTFIDNYNRWCQVYFLKKKEMLWISLSSLKTLQKIKPDIKSNFFNPSTG